MTRVIIKTSKKLDPLEKDKILSTVRPAFWPNEPDIEEPEFRVDENTKEITVEIVGFPKMVDNLKFWKEMVENKLSKFNLVFVGGEID